MQLFKLVHSIVRQIPGARLRSCWTISNNNVSGNVIILNNYVVVYVRARRIFMQHILGKHLLR